MTSFFQAVLFLWSGMYGDFALIGVGNGILIIIQLVISTLIITWLITLMEMEYGLGDRSTIMWIYLFFFVNAAQALFWTFFSSI